MRILVSLVFLISACVPLAFGQFSGVNVAEVQFGKLPNEAADPFPSLYDRAVLNYRYGKLKASATIEQYQVKYEDRRYFDLSQLRLGYKTKHWDIKLGNFYETIGRGMAIRSFEIPASILEDIGFRSRSYFHRDILGGSAAYQTKKWKVQLLHGEILNNLLPPTFDRSDRRTETVSGMTGSYKISQRIKLGANLINIKEDNLSARQIAGGSVSGDIANGLSYYVEYAHSFSQANDYALYAGLTGYVGELTYNVEYKKYENFIIGSGLNEPPALIKQHTYKVLNRSTHVTNPLNEEGYQIDLYYPVGESSSINFNHALAANTFGATNFIFRELFAEWSSSLREGLDYKIFLDYAQDPFKGEADRWSTGLYVDLALGGEMRLLPEVEYQRFNRFGSAVNNQSYSLGLHLDKTFFVSVILETTTDPFLVDTGESSRAYLGSNIRFKPNYKNTFQLFLGERRGGPLCNAGVCYEILDFKGIETRWTVRF